MATLNYEDSNVDLLRDWLPKDAEVLLTFPVLHAGWEMDERGWIVELPGGEQRCVLTSHGSPSWADEAQLTELIERYELAMAGAAKALEAIRRASDPDAA